MEPLTEKKIVLVVRQTRLDELVARYNTVSQAQFYVEHLGADFSDYQREDEVYKAGVRKAQAELSRLGRVQVLPRAYLSNYLFGRQDLIVVLGQDGLVANTLKYLDGHSVVAVNPDPPRYDGVLLPFEVSDLGGVVSEVIGGKRKFKTIRMAKAALNNGQVLYGVNDLFIGQKTHVSARYLLSVGKQSESQSSSGIIVSTGLGSTGWLKSVLTGAAAIAKGDSRRTLEAARNMRWDSDYLYYSVREPFASRVSQASLVFGKISGRVPMQVVSQMSENGVIFSDGIESDYLEFNAGTQAVVSVAEKEGVLVI